MAYTDGDSPVSSDGKIYLIVNNLVLNKLKIKESQNS